MGLLYDKLPPRRAEENNTYPAGCTHVALDFLEAAMQLPHLEHEVKREWQQSQRLQTGQKRIQQSPTSRLAYAASQHHGVSSVVLG